MFPGAVLVQVVSSYIVLFVILCPLCALSSQQYKQILHDRVRGYDFIYLPYDFQRDSNLGYAFVNLREESGQVRSQQSGTYNKRSLQYMQEYLRFVKVS